MIVPSGTNGATIYRYLDMKIFQRLLTFPQTGDLSPSSRHHVYLISRGRQQHGRGITLIHRRRTVPLTNGRRERYFVGRGLAEPARLATAAEGHFR